jgi:hypothetical protein
VFGVDQLEVKPATLEVDAAIAGAAMAATVVGGAVAGAARPAAAPPSDEHAVAARRTPPVARRATATWATRREVDRAGWSAFMPSIVSVAIEGVVGRAGDRVGRRLLRRTDAEVA